MSDVISKIAELLKVGDDLLKNQQIDRAAEYFVKALDSDQNCVEALIKLAEISLLVNRPTAAKEFLDKAFQIGGEREDFLQACGRLYLKSGCLEKNSRSQGQTVASRIPAAMPIKRLGDDSCGWSCLPDLLSADSIVYCVGCGENVSFDLALMELAGCDIFAFDPTPKSLAYLRSLNLSENYRIFDCGLADFDGTAQFNPPVDPTHVSHTIASRPQTSSSAINVEMKKLSTIMQELGHKHIDLLKIDIEGAEYAVLEDLLKNNLPVDQIMVEYHHFLDNWSLENTFQSLLMLITSGYSLFAVHGHTDYCFVRNERLRLTARNC